MDKNQMIELLKKDLEFLLMTWLLWSDSIVMFWGLR